MTAPTGGRLLPIVIVLLLGLSGLLSLALLLAGSTFANEPGGGGLHGLLDRAVIYGPIVLTAVAAVAARYFWTHGQRNLAGASAVAPLVVLALLVQLLAL